MITTAVAIGAAWLTIAVIGGLALGRIAQLGTTPCPCGTCGR